MSQKLSSAAVVIGALRVMIKRFIVKYQRTTLKWNRKFIHMFQPTLAFIDCKYKIIDRK